MKSGINNIKKIPLELGTEEQIKIINQLINSDIDEVIYKKDAFFEILYRLEISFSETIIERSQASHFYEFSKWIRNIENNFPKEKNMLKAFAENILSKTEHIPS